MYSDCVLVYGEYVCRVCVHIIMLNFVWWVLSTSGNPRGIDISSILY